MISNSELKFIRSLKIKKYRQAASCFLIEGEKNVLELVNSDFSIRHIVGSEAFFASNPEVERHQQAVKSSAKVVSSLSSLSSNDLVVAVAEMKKDNLDELDQSKFILALDGISDPGNLGTIIRTLDWFGFDQLLISKSSVDTFNPKTISATMGSFTRVKVVQDDLVPFLNHFKGVKVGAQMAGETPNKLNRESNPILLIMGSESHGISPEVQGLLDYSVTIPQLGSAESLNVGVASGILCYELSIKDS